MVAAENDFVAVEVDLVGNGVDVIAEISGLHSSIAAELVDLVCCTFNEDGRVETFSLFKNGLDGEFIGGAVGRYSGVYS